MTSDDPPWTEACGTDLAYTVLAAAIHNAGVSRSRNLGSGGSTRSGVMLVSLTWVVVHH
jgi:hypothetical protein